MEFLNKEHEKAINQLRLGEFDLALDFIQQALNKVKSHPVLLAERATIYMYLNQRELAMNDLNLALDLQPDNPYRYASRAYVKDFFGDTKGAIEDYERCLELDPEDIITMNNLGLLIEKLGNKTKAQRYFKKTDELLQRNPEWKNRIAEQVEDPKQNAQNNDPSKTQHSTPFKKDQQTQKTLRKSALIKEVFTKKSVFQEFISFIKNGFKLK